MATVDELRQYLRNPNVRQVLDVISQAEGTDKYGYGTAFGGGQLQSLADHPRQLHDFTQTDGTRNKTSAAGRYQFLQKTWDDVAGQLGLSDFGPESQDIAAVELLRRAGALEPAASGDFQTALQRSGGTWASLPSSPYAQPKRSEGFMSQALDRAAQAIFPSAQAAERIDPAAIQWDDTPPAPQIDASSITWDEPASEGAPMRVEMAHEEPAWQRDSTIAAIGAGLGAGVGQVALGAQRYLGQGLQAIGADTAGDWLVRDADEGRARLQQQLQPYREESPIAAGGGELAGNIAATLPVGGLLARGVRAAAPMAGGLSGTANRLAESLATGGLRVGATPQTGAVGNALLRAAGGGAGGAVSAGLVNQDDAGTGGIVGAAFPVVGRAIGAGAQAAGRALRGGEISQPVRALADRAAELGIQIPADRIANSRPLNAVASGLNYVPFSGRAAVEDRMQDQLNRALTRTFGQDSTNVTQALRQASSDLGKQFDDVLSSTAVRVDDQFLNDLATAADRAARELGSDQAGIIQRQIDEIISKGATGQIEGQAAYNIKRTLDRIGKRNTPEAFYADDLRRSLMDALNRSLGPEAAEAFGQTRRQYGNMLSLERLAQNGAEGDISIARLANLRNIRNPDLQELADIAAQFLRPRESQHSAAQRAFAGIGAGIVGGPAALAGGAAAGRGLNRLLDSTLARNAVMAQPGQAGAIENSLNRLLPLTYRSAPVLSAQ